MVVLFRLLLTLLKRCLVPAVVEDHAPDVVPDAVLDQDLAPGQLVRLPVVNQINVDVIVVEVDAADVVDSGIES